MDISVYIGVGFIILCLSFLIFVTGIVGYSFKLTKKELDVAPSQKHIKP